MLSVSYACKNAYSAGIASGVLRGAASEANWCYVLAHCGPHQVNHKTALFTLLYSTNNLIHLISRIDPTGSVCHQWQCCSGCLNEIVAKI